MLQGIGLTFFIAVVALGVNALFPPVSPVIIAVLMGMLLKNTRDVPDICYPGVKCSAKQLLKWGIILLGIRLSFFEIVNLGATSLLIIVICIVLALSLVITLSHQFRVPRKLATLIAIGTAICGNSAIVASAPVIKAREEEVAFAVATITVFGLSAIVVYPLIGGLLGLSAVEFGTWAGTAINDTGQVVAAGFLYGDVAGEVATVVKLTRNLFIAPVVFLFSYLTIRQESRGRRSGPDGLSKADVNIFQIFPWFVLGFLAMAVLRTTGVLPGSIIELISFFSNLLIVMALAGIGLGIEFSSLRGMGLKAFATGLFASVVMGATSLLLIWLIL